MRRVYTARAAWRKSSRSGGLNGGGGECVEVATVWRKSSRSGSNNGDGQCVEAADLRSAVGLRDSKNPDGPVLAVDRSGWHRFVATIKDGSLDRP